MRTFWMLIITLSLCLPGTTVVAPSKKPRVIHVCYIMKDFDAADRVAIQDALTVWNSYFSLTGTIFKLDGDDCLIVIERKDMPPDRHAQIQREFVGYTMTLMPETHNHDAIVSFVVHEIGHCFGMRDCFWCNSVMGYSRGPNVGTGHTRLTETDLIELKNAIEDHADWP